MYIVLNIFPGVQLAKRNVYPFDLVAFNVICFSGLSGDYILLRRAKQLHYGLSAH